MEKNIAYSSSNCWIDIIPFLYSEWFGNWLGGYYRGVYIHMLFQRYSSMPWCWRWSRCDKRASERARSKIISNVSNIATWYWLGSIIILGNKLQWTHHHDLTSFHPLSCEFNIQHTYIYTYIMYATDVTISSWPIHLDIQRSTLMMAGWSTTN